MQSKKSKRIYEIKSEKEKQKREDEERKKKLAELYRKQRFQTASSSGLHESRPKLIKLTNKNDSNSSNEYHDIGINKPPSNNATSNLISNKTSKLYEQDMSKILLDKITYLLNDNDKLVEKQRRQLHNTKSNNQKVLTQSLVKKVDFVVSEFFCMRNCKLVNPHFNTVLYYFSYL